MCGICGIFDLKKQIVGHDILKSMTDVMSHRGPDGEGIWAEENFGIGHRRLSIIDLSAKAAQPMFSADRRFLITYNGEVYNFKSIRDELKSLGYKFKSTSDTEVVLKAYVEWKEKCVDKFNGMFAFAIWDRNEKRLFVARDRYGIKPLYYYFKEGLLVFGSEIKSLLKHPKIKREVDICSLNEYFSFQNTLSDRTLFKDIKMLMPGHYFYMQSENRDIVPVKYWDFSFREDFSDLSFNDCVAETTKIFEDSVKRQLVSDVEIGAYLSGGIDSGAVTCVAANNFKNLKSFTTGFDLSSANGLELAFDERTKAEYLSNIYKTEHYEVVLKAGDMERIMDDLVWHLEDLRVGQCYPNFYVARLASKFTKVCLSGAGSDEIFAGYPWRYYSAVVNDNFKHYADKYYRYWQRLIPDRFKPKFYQEDIYPQIWNYQCKDVFADVLKGVVKDDVSPSDYVNNSLYFEAKTFLHGLLVVEDKLSMANSLETRVPFLDNELVDFAAKIPVRYKLRNLDDVVKINENEPGPKTKKYFEKTNDGKLVLRGALKNFVPENYANGIKQGFSAPDASWFKGQSMEYVKDIIFNDNAKIYDYMQPAFVQELVSEHLDGKKIYFIF